MPWQYKKKSNSQHWWNLYITALRENLQLEKKIKQLQRRIKELETKLASTT